ncbi:Kinesin light chain [Seminavis robusta]|uniref:Kinesin light chain n=1 Tax=Seminavis robusta TaxID=568900 RepID=A0A9N8EKG3_9STRA|nr:Kinesin light chain [Seminavis robusta]|eukprot:Sro1130_g244490.1 Kinesin light chain (566) ;mRNA; r:16253-18230
MSNDEQPEVLSAENRASFLAEDDVGKEKPQYVLTSKGELVRHSDTTATKTSLVLDIAQFPESNSSSHLFALGEECHIQISPCKKYLALYFQKAELVWMLDFNKQILYKLDWKASVSKNLVKVKRCSISFQENATAELEAVVSMNVEAEKEATAQALFCSIQGQHKQAMELASKKLPADSEELATVYEQIGCIARDLGDYEAGGHALEEAIRIYKKNLGSTHEKVARGLHELGNLLDDEGKYKDAMDKFFESLDIRQNNFGNDSPLVADVFYSMGYTLQNQDSVDQALDCFEESWNINKVQLGPDAKEVGNAANIMGYLQAKRGQLDDALSLLWDALRIRKLQEDQVKVSETLRNIGNVHREKEEHELAIECYEECLRLRKLELGERHAKVADALVGLGNVKSDQGKHAEASQSYEEALSIRRECFGEEDVSVAKVLEKLGSNHFQAEEYDQAIQQLTRAIDIREAKEERDGDYVNALFMIGNIHKMRGDEEAAIRWWTQAYERFQELGLAESNPQVAQVMESLLGNKQPGVMDKLQKALKDFAKKLTWKKKVSPGSAAQTELGEE